VSTPLGAPAQQLVRYWTTPQPCASGDRVAFAQNDDVWVWSAATGRVAVSGTPGVAEWDPWLDGDRVVWVSTRNGSGDRFAPDNPEIYLRDLAAPDAGADPEADRVTVDPPDRPAVQTQPALDGDWLVWVDFRNAARPNGSLEQPGSEIWGYHLPTHRTLRLARTVHTDPERVRMAFPRVLGGRLYYLTQEVITLGGVGRTITSLFEQTLPTP
jgi:hypothetical protein